MADTTASQQAQISIPLLNDKVYNTLKHAATIVLPAAITLYILLAQIWSWPDQAQIVASLGGVNTFVGVVVAGFRALYNNTDTSDGALTIENGEDGSTLRMTSVDVQALATKDTVTFKINRPAPTEPVAISQ